MIVLLTAVLVRLVLALLARSARARTGGQRTARGPSAPPSTLLWAVATWMIVPLKCALWGIEMWNGEMWAAPWLLAGTVVLFPWWWAHRVLVPLGLPRIAYVVARLSAYHWRGDTAGGAVVAAAWALAHQRTPAPSNAAAFVRARRDRLQPLRGGGILATALLADLRDDRPGMLALTRSVLLLAPDARHDAARGLATQWLCAHAAAQGDWAAVASTTEGIGSLPAAARLLALLARAHRPQPIGALGRAQLLGAWLSAPHRRDTWHMVRHALRAASGATQHSDANDPSGDPADPGSDRAPPSARTPATAVAAHARLSATPPALIDPAQLVAVALSWEQVLHSARLRQDIAARSEALGAHRGDPLATTRQQIVDELAAVLSRRPPTCSPIEDPPALLREAAMRVQSQATAEVEACWEPIERRRREGGVLPAIDHWREFVALQAAYATAVALRGDVGRRLLFDDTDTAVSNLAAGLWNNHQERSIANAMFAWLLTEAEAVDDAEAIGRLTRNVRSGVG